MILRRLYNETVVICYTLGVNLVVSFAVIFVKFSCDNGDNRPVVFNSRGQ